MFDPDKKKNDAQCPATKKALEILKESGIRTATVHFNVKPTPTSTGPVVESNPPMTRVEMEESIRFLTEKLGKFENIMKATVTHVKACEKRIVELEQAIDEISQCSINHAHQISKIRNKIINKTEE